MPPVRGGDVGANPTGLKFSHLAISMGPWLECGKGICFASRQIVGSTPIGSTNFRK